MVGRERKVEGRVEERERREKRTGIEDRQVDRREEMRMEDSEVKEFEKEERIEEEDGREVHV
ncbi:hypothetical protein, partial [Burkholderia cenocepacia]|uniref:hypothetical protein n=1 Tax=Burkholderia cenocepacia TaxID=95486 RepID=UPI00406CE595